MGILGYIIERFPQRSCATTRGERTMKRRVLLASGLVTTLTVFSLSASSMAQDRERTSDGAHRIAYGIDPITGEYLFAEDIDPLVLDLSEALPRETSALSGNTIEMNQVAMVPWTRAVLSTSKGFDFDEDGKREFITRLQGDTVGSVFFYECNGDDSFVLVHTLEIPGESLVSYYPDDVGDADGDGLKELSVFGRTHNDFHLRLYESESTATYPTSLAWEVGGPAADGWFGQVGAKIADTDVDGKQEIVSGGWFFNERRIVVYENDGDNSYNLTYTELLPGQMYAQSLAVLNDFDGDGRDEILFGGLPAETATSLVAYESTGDNTYEVIWTWYFDPFVNMSFIVDAGDLDGDGKKEFLVGGFAPNGPFGFMAHLFEVVSDNNFEIVATFGNPFGDAHFPVAAVADVDGDGRREIVLGSGNTLRIYANSGALGWTQIWAKTMNLWNLATGDIDADGKEELIVSELSAPSIVIWEIDPADAADMDNDHVVDAIDNCPNTSNSDQADADSDTVGNVCDNCIYGPNPTQGPAIFGQQIQAFDSETFSWSEPAEVVYVRGDLALVSTYTVDLVRTVPFGTSFMDSSLPASGEGFFYLVKPNCGVGSWQTSLGAEPGRDLTLP